MATFGRDKKNFLKRRKKKPNNIKISGKRIAKDPKLFTKRLLTSTKDSPLFEKDKNISAPVPIKPKEKRV